MSATHHVLAEQAKHPVVYRQNDGIAIGFKVTRERGLPRAGLTAEEKRRSHR
jgi:hypothetical protein